MVITETEKELGACVGGMSVDSDEMVYGVGVVKKDAEISYLIRRFETNDFTDGAPAMAYYLPVRTNTIEFYDKVVSLGNLGSDNYDQVNLDNITRMIDEASLNDDDNQNCFQNKVNITEENRKTVAKALILDSNNHLNN